MLVGFEVYDLDHLGLWFFLWDNEVYNFLVFYGLMWFFTNVIISHPIVDGNIW